jgi:hypothetical protein
VLSGQVLGTGEALLQAHVLWLTVQPAASAGATLRVIIDIGKFQGVMAATTPTCREYAPYQGVPVVQGGDRDGTTGAWKVVYPL